MDIEKELEVIAKVSNGFKPMKSLADKLISIHSPTELESIAYKLYESKIYQIRMVSVFLFGRITASNIDILYFLKNEVSQDENWCVQEILAMAFDNYCKDIGYENALEIIKSWLCDNNCNTRRAVLEELRIWTSRPFFKTQKYAAKAFFPSIKPHRIKQLYKISL